MAEPAMMDLFKLFDYADNKAKSLQHASDDMVGHDDVEAAAAYEHSASSYRDMRNKIGEVLRGHAITTHKFASQIEKRLSVTDEVRVNAKRR